MRTLIRLMVIVAVTGTTGCAAFNQSGNQKVATQTQVIQQGKVDPTPAQRELDYESAFSQGLRGVQEEQYGIALGAFEEAVRIRPDSGEAMFNLAACYEAVGDPLRAIHIYKGLIVRYPTDADCYTNLGTSYIKMYYREKTPSWKAMAVEAWNRSLELRKNQPRVRQFLAQANTRD